VCVSYREVSSTDVKVRKQHMCGWCSEAISKGEAARARSYIFDGQFISDWMHPECFTAMNNSNYRNICEGWTPGDFERGIAT
jgi:hypothetical protein